MDKILITILIVVWVTVLSISLVGYISKVIEKQKIHNMPQAEKFAYLLGKYGRHWNNYFDEIP